MARFDDLEGVGKAFEEFGKGAVDIVGGVGDVIGGLNDVGSFISDVGGRVGLDDVALAGDRLAGLGEKLPVTKVLREVSGSEILDAGQVIIAGMRLTTGVGEPDTGERFGQGSARFREVEGTLEAAGPDDSWAGAGSDGYVARNRSQLGQTEALAVLDRGVQTVLAREAYQVKYHRDKLDTWSNYLADLSYVTFALQFIPGIGKTMKAAIEAAAVHAALSVSSLELYELSNEAEQNAAELRQVVGRYAGVADATKDSEVDAPWPLPKPSVSTPMPEPPQAQATQTTAGPGLSSAATSDPAESEPAVAAPRESAPNQPLAEIAALGPTPAADALATLGAVLAPLGALLSGAGQGGQAPPSTVPPATGQNPVPVDAVGRTAPKDKRNKNDRIDDDGRDGDAATPGDVDSERAPVHVEVDIDADRLGVPVTVVLDPPRSAPRAEPTAQE